MLEKSRNSEYEVINETMFYVAHPSIKYVPERTKAFIDFFSKKLREVDF